MKLAAEQEHLPVWNLHEKLRRGPVQQVEDRRRDPLQLLRIMTASERGIE